MRSFVRRRNGIDSGATPSARARADQNDEWSDDLRDTGTERCGRRSRSAMVDDGGYLRKEPAMIDVREVDHAVSRRLVGSPNHYEWVP